MHKINILVGVWFLSFCSRFTCFWVIYQNVIFPFLFTPPAESFCWIPSTGGLENEEKNRPFVNSSKRVNPEQKLKKTDPNWNIFLVKKIFLNFFVAAKLSKWRPFCVQNTKGRGALNFAATKKFQKYFFTRKIFQPGCI